MVKLLGNVQHHKTKQALVFAHINCTDAIANYKNKTVEFEYNNALSLLQTKNRLDARTAFDALTKVNSMQSGYMQTAQLLLEAKTTGTTYVLITLHNTSYLIMPRQLEQQLLNISNYGLQKPWIVYHTKVQNNVYYHYNINMNISNIAISGENMETKLYDNDKEVSDGFAYKTDANGHEILDTLGNKIRVEKFKTIHAHVKEFHQNKQAQITAKVAVIDNTSGHLLHTAPIAYSYNWTNTYAEFRGSKDALTDHARNLTKHHFIAYPNNEALLNYTEQGLKDNFKIALLHQTPSVY
jgi:hypothetical protein